MSELLPVSEDQRDVLQEICNVAMGVAGESLAELSGVFVELPIPKVRFIEPKNVVDALAQLRGDDCVSGVIQSYSASELLSYSLVVITETGIDDLAQQLSTPSATAEQRATILMRLNSTITQACNPILQEQLGLPVMQTSDAELIAQNVLLNELSVPQLAQHQKLLSVEINYHLEGHPFNCDLLLLIADDAIDYLTSSIDALL
jgi:chemotaxis protein CheC